MPAATKKSESIIDLEHDDLRPVAEIAAERTGRRPPPGTVWRWRLKGCHGEKLEAVLVHGVWCTTVSAFADFIRRQTAAAMANCKGASESETPERDERKTRQLQAAGLLG